MDANFYLVMTIVALLCSVIAYLMGNRTAKQTQLELELIRVESIKTSELLTAAENVKAVLQAEIQQGKIQCARSDADKQATATANQLLFSELTKLKQDIESFRTDTEQAKQQSAAAQSELAGNHTRLQDFKIRFDAASKELIELRTNNSTLQAELSEAKTAKSSLEKQTTQLDQHLRQLVAEKNDLQQLNTGLTRDSSEAKAQLQSESAKSQDLRSRLTAIESAYKQQLENFQRISESYTQLKTSQQEKELHFAEQLKLLQDNKLELKKDFEHLERVDLWCVNFVQSGAASPRKELRSLVI